MSKKKTEDMNFVLRQMQEECENNTDLYADLYVDLTKTYDTVSSDELWKILARLGCPQSFSPSSTSCMEVSKVR